MSNVGWRRSARFVCCCSSSFCRMRLCLRGFSRSSHQFADGALPYRMGGAFAFPECNLFKDRQCLGEAAPADVKPNDFSWGARQLRTALILDILQIGQDRAERGDICVLIGGVVLPAVG